MRVFLNLIAVLAVALSPLPSAGAESGGPWRWYYSAFGSPELGAKVFARSGVATIYKSPTTIQIAMQEVGGTTATFAGRVSASKLQGQLSNFFPSGGEFYQGTYKQLQVGSCKFEQIALSPGAPDGSTLMFSRISGHCQ